MSYLALARQWRPRTFVDVVGQEHVTTPLKNALRQGRLHHAYLFTGTRGVGKTSLGRLLAKALNCEQSITPEPCLSCSACLGIEQGAFIDLIEVDGASRTRVEDTRDLLENVLYLPATGRFKIYLIDEVHMLSQHSFNALLKTLEEPPAHVKFILATTEPHKLPATILSRCLQFHLRHLSPKDIQKQLNNILKSEGLPTNAEAIGLLSKAAKGSMRDALSLLEQAISSASNSIQELNLDDVRKMLGYTHQDYAIELLQALAAADALSLLKISRQIAVEGGYFQYTLEELLHYLHQLMIAQHLALHTQQSSKIVSEIVDQRMAQESLQVLIKQFTPEDVQLFYHIGLKGAEEMQLAPTPALGFEMMLLRMLTFKPAALFSNPSPPPAAAVKGPVVTKPIEKNNALESISRPTPPTAYDPNPAAIAARTIQEPQPMRSDDWPVILAQLNLQGFALLAAQNSEFVSKVSREITLRTARGHHSLFTAYVIEAIESALAKHYQEKIKLIIIQSDKPLQASPAEQHQKRQVQDAQSAKESLAEDAFCQQLQKTFSAELSRPEMLPTDKS
ncbi:MAG: DNA polymerase III subunit gamma/tau [Legionella sp.]|nr:DNA polymerase III subunit gamma/tau [Legionella sp.]